MGERGVPFEPFVQGGGTGYHITLSRNEAMEMNFATIQGRRCVFIDGVPLADTWLRLSRSGSQLRIDIMLDDDPLNPSRDPRSATMRTLLAEATRAMEAEGNRFRAARRLPRITMWTSRYQRGDAILRYVESEFARIRHHAYDLLAELSDHLRQ